MSTISQKRNRGLQERRDERASRLELSLTKVVESTRPTIQPLETLFVYLVFN